MKYFSLAGVVYKLFIRTPLKKAIDDPKTEWDDHVLDALDTIFSYSKK